MRSTPNSLACSPVFLRGHPMFRRYVIAAVLMIYLPHLPAQQETSLQNAQNALRIYEANTPQAPTLSQTLICLAVAESMLGRYSEADAHLNRVMSLLAQASMENGPEAAAGHSALGMLYFKQGRYFD